jgi:esterase
MPASLNTTVWGRARPTLFCIHGFGDGAFVWEPLFDSLGLDGNGIALDLQGHGASSRATEGRYSTAAHMRDALAAFEQFDLHDVVLIGHSLGAAVAAHLAITHQRRVRALVVIDSGPELRAEATQRMMTQFRSQRWEYASAEEYAGILSRRHPLAPPASIESYARGALRPRAPRGVELRCDPALKEMVFGPESAQAWAALTALDRPVLLARGGMSAVLPSDAARRYAAALPRGRLVNVPLAGHAVMVENPVGYLSAVRDFLVEIGYLERARCPA